MMGGKMSQTPSWPNPLQEGKSVYERCAELPLDVQLESHRTVGELGWRQMTT